MKLLIVDDDPSFRRSVELYFSRESVSVLQANGGRQALEVLAREGVDLIVSDLRMPLGDGMELLAALKERPSAPPVILLTGLSDPAARAEAHRLGAHSVLEKPLSVKELVQRVKAAFPG
jgi:DNA-binding response OmpR family regulator